MARDSAGIKATSLLSTWNTQWALRTTALPAPAPRVRGICWTPGHRAGWVLPSLG